MLHDISVLPQILLLVCLLTFHTSRRFIWVQTSVYLFHIVKWQCDIITVLPTLVQPVQEGGMVMAGAMSLQTCKWQLYMQQLLLEEEAVAPCSLSWVPSLLPHQALQKTGLCLIHINSDFCLHNKLCQWNLYRRKCNWMENENNIYCPELKKLTNNSSEPRTIQIRKLMLLLEVCFTSFSSICSYFVAFSHVTYLTCSETLWLKSVIELNL